MLLCWIHLKPIDCRWRLIKRYQIMYLSNVELKNSFCYNRVVCILLIDLLGVGHWFFTPCGWCVETGQEVKAWLRLKIASWLKQAQLPKDLSNLLFNGNNKVVSFSIIERVLFTLSCLPTLPHAVLFEYSFHSFFLFYKWHAIIFWVFVSLDD